MKKGNKIIYWIATIWLSLGMLSSAIVQLIQLEEETEFIINLGYPLYILPLLGIWKILGVAAILIPKYPLIKEWAYAGFFFVMSGALYSHVVVGDEAFELFGPGLMVVLTILSWYFRPENRKIQIIG